MDAFMGEDVMTPTNAAHAKTKGFRKLEDISERGVAEMAVVEALEETTWTHGWTVLVGCDENSGSAIDSPCGMRLFSASGESSWVCPSPWKLAGEGATQGAFLPGPLLRRLMRFPHLYKPAAMSPPTRAPPNADTSETNGATHHRRARSCATARAWSSIAALMSVATSGGSRGVRETRCFCARQVVIGGS